MLIAALLAAAPVVTSPKPINNPGDWASSGDYPAEALKAKAYGTVRFRVEVKDDGTPLKCDVIEGSGNASLDNKTCELVLSRAAFGPAGEDGYSVRNTYQSSIRWSFPAPSPLNKITTEGNTGTAKISADGAIIGCIDRLIGNPSDDPVGCSFIRNEALIKSRLPSALQFYEQITVRILIKPTSAQEPAISGYMSGDEHIVLTTADFTVPASGYPQDCVASEWIVEGEDLDICQIFAGDENKFEPDAQRTTPVPMQVLIEMWAKKRMAD